MSGISVWAFIMASRRRAIVKPIQIVSKLNAKYFYAIRSLDMHVKIIFIGPTGDIAWGNSRTIYNL